MTDRPTRVGERRPSSLTTFVWMVITAGVALSGLAAWVAAQEGIAPLHPTLFVVFGASLLAAELRPVSWLRQSDQSIVTVSMAYACALMFLLPGFATAVAVAAVSALADGMRRTPPLKVAFNASMMGLSIAAGQLVLRAGGADTLVGADRTSPLLFLTVVGACAAMYAVSALVMVVVIALASGQDVLTVAKRDFFMTLPTDGILLPLGPVLVVVGRNHPALLPFAMLLTAAVFRSARDAAERERDATHDALTGLPNRRLLDDTMDGALESAQRAGAHVAMLLLDLDGFKAINDTFGHQVGDDVLVEVAARLRGLDLGEATVSRLGGDEFAVLLPEVQTIEDAELVAVTIEHAIAAPMASVHAEGVDLTVGASIGVAMSGPRLTTMGELLRAADGAMYEAKRGEGGHAVADLESRSSDRMADLERAIAGDELFLVYQPLIDVRTEAVLGFEALVRWDRPGFGVVMPDSFMPLAEATPLIGPLTERVLDEALGHLVDLTAAGHRVGMSVNVSAHNLADPGFVASVHAALRRHDVEPERLTLEITETAVMRDTRKAALAISRLRALGVAFALDDFGAGHSSLAKLRDLPVTGLKIDRSFLLAGDTDRGQQLIRTLVELGRSMGMSTTAEGVEDRTVLGFLAESGCAQAQGHGIGRPMAAAENAAWLAGRASLDRRSPDHTAPWGISL